MHTSEWALVAFTLLGQLAVGSLLAAEALRLEARRAAGRDAADRLADVAAWAAVPVLAVALAASLLHLGNPINAFWTVANVGRSWLSREILFAGLFTGSVALLAGLRWFRVGTPAARNAVGLVAASLGVTLVYCMSRIYMLRAVPAWNSAATPLSFFTTTLLLGTIATGAMLVVHLSRLRRDAADPLGPEAQWVRQALRWLGLAALVLLGIQLVLEPLRLAALSHAGGPGLRSVSAVLDASGAVFGGKLALSVAGAGVFGLWLQRHAADPERERTTERIVLACFTLVVVSETLGRALFYAMYQKVGL